MHIHIKYLAQTRKRDALHQMRTLCHLINKGTLDANFVIDCHKLPCNSNHHGSTDQQEHMNNQSVDRGVHKRSENTIYNSNKNISFQLPHQLMSCPMDSS